MLLNFNLHQKLSACFLLMLMFFFCTSLKAQQVEQKKTVELLPVDSSKLEVQVELIEDFKKSFIMELGKSLANNQRFNLIQNREISSDIQLDAQPEKLSDYTIASHILELKQSKIDEAEMLFSSIEMIVYSAINDKEILRFKREFEVPIEDSVLLSFNKGISASILEFRQDLSQQALFFRFAEIADLRNSEIILDIGQNKEVQIGDQFDVFEADSLSNELNSEKKARVVVTSMRGNFAIVHLLSFIKPIMVGDQAQRVNHFGLEIGIQNSYYLQQTVPGGSKISEDNTVPFDVALHISLNKFVYYIRPYLQLGLIFNTDWLLKDVQPGYQAMFAALGLEYRLNLGVFNISPHIDLALVSIDPIDEQALFVAGAIVRSKINLSVNMFDVLKIWIEAGYQIGFGESMQGFITNSLGFGISLQ